MIYDKLDNIEFYRGLSEDIYEGLKFIKQAPIDIANGVYQINPNVKVIVSEYDTKYVNENGYEAHRKNIDIQYPLSGIEKIKSEPISHLKVTKEYDSENDYLLFDGEMAGTDFIIGNGYFLCLFPEDGHMPQLCVNTPERIKKITIKVLLK